MFAEDFASVGGPTAGTLPRVSLDPVSFRIFFFNIFSTLFFLPSRFFPNFLGPPFVACRHKNKEGVAECPSHNRNSKLQKCFSCFFYIYASWVWIREWCNYGGRHSTGVDESPVVYPARSLDTVPEHHYFQCFYH